LQVTPTLRLATPLLGWPLTEHQARTSLSYSCIDSALDLTYWIDDGATRRHPTSKCFASGLGADPLAYNPAIHSPTRRSPWLTLLSLPTGLCPLKDAFRPKWLVSAWHSPAWGFATFVSRQFKPSRLDHLTISQHLHCRKVSVPTEAPTILLANRNRPLVQPTGPLAMGPAYRSSYVALHCLVNGLPH
jgi:hypothetical protein